MSEKYVAYNLTKGIVSFGLAVAVAPEELEGLPSHRRRRTLKSNIIQIVIPYGESMDLVEKTGLSADQIKSSAELIKLISRNAVRVEVSNVKEDPKPEEAPRPQTRTLDEPVDEKVQEDAPEEEADSEGKKASKKSDKKSKKSKKKG